MRVMLSSIRNRFYNSQSAIRIPQSILARPEPLAVLAGGDEGLDHLGLDEVSAERVELAEPEVVACRVGVATEVAEVLHQDEGAGELGVGEGRVLSHAAPDARARRLVGRVGRRAELADGRV